VVSIAESDALGPLRFQTAEPGETCEGSACIYTLTSGATVRVMSRPPLASECSDRNSADLILVYEPDSSATGEDAPVLVQPQQDVSGTSPWACPNVLSWTDIQRDGGARFQVTGTGLDVTYARKCSRRPWRRCD